MAQQIGIEKPSQRGITTYHGVYTIIDFTQNRDDAANIDEVTIVFKASRESDPPLLTRTYTGNAAQWLLNDAGETSYFYLLSADVRTLGTGSFKFSIDVEEPTGTHHIVRTGSIVVNPNYARDDDDEAFLTPAEWVTPKTFLNALNRASRTASRARAASIDDIYQADTLLEAGATSITLSSLEGDEIDNVFGYSGDNTINIVLDDGTVFSSLVLSVNETTLTVTFNTPLTGTSSKYNTVYPGNFDLTGYGINEAD